VPHLLRLAQLLLCLSTPGDVDGFWYNATTFPSASHMAQTAKSNERQPVGKLTDITPDGFTGCGCHDTCRRGCSAQQDQLLRWRNRQGYNRGPPVEMIQQRRLRKDVSVDQDAEASHSYVRAAPGRVFARLARWADDGTLVRGMHVEFARGSFVWRKKLMLMIGRKAPGASLRHWDFSNKRPGNPAR
jgi:hypothetical protein